MKLSKNKIIKIIGLSCLALVTVCGFVPIILLPFRQATIYKITNNSSTQINFDNKLPTQIKKGNGVNVAYTIEDSKVLDEEYSDLFVNELSIKNKTGVIFNNNQLTIPASLITGDLTIKLVAATQYTVSNIGSADIAFDNLPTTVLEGHKIETNYTITTTKALDEEYSSIKVGDTSIKEQESVEFKNGKLLIPTSLITDNVTIGLISAGTFLVTNTSSGVDIVDLPTTILERHGIDTTYTIKEGNYRFNESKCDITVDGESIIDKAGVVFTSGSLVIPGEYVTGNLEIHIHADLYITLSFEAGAGGTISSTTSVEVVALTTWSELEAEGKIPTTTPDDQYKFYSWFSKGGVKLTPTTQVKSDMKAIARFVENGISPIVTNVVENNDQKIAWYDSESGQYEIDTHEIIPNVCHFNNLPIGYISLANYFDNNIYASYYTYNTDTTNETVTISNNKNSSTVIIYFKEQKAVFSDFEKFIDYETSYGPLTGGCGGGTRYYSSVTVDSYINENERIVNFNNYNIKLFFYNNEGYIPYEVYENVFHILSRLKSYISGAFDYNGSYFVQIISGLQTQTAKAAAKNITTDEFKGSNYMQYSYDLLALTLDNRYGLVERKRRDTGTIDKKIPNGAYDMMSNYYDAYVKAEDETSAAALSGIFKDNLDDCGHTTFSCQNMFSTKAIQYYQEVYGDETINIQIRKSTQISNARTTALGETIEGYKEYEDPEKGKIAYITFDSFVSQSGLNGTEETTKNRELPSGTTESNYSNDTLRLTMWANQHIQEDDIKNVVVDLSCNGGGAVYTEHFIASWLCGGVTEKIYNPKTKSYCEYTVKADINGDDAFDENDYLAEDVKLYIITTSNSFSCGNMLPTNVQDNRPTNTTFVGTSSGGGACFVDSNLLIGANATIRISSSNHMLRKDSSYGNFITNDTGCTISELWAIDDSTAEGQAALFDRETLNNRIWGKI